MCYIPLDRPEALPADVLSCSPSHQGPLFSEILELVGKGRLHTTDKGIFLLVRQPSPLWSATPGGSYACLLNDEHIRIYVQLLMRPWVMQLTISQLPATCEPRAPYVCSHVYTGGSVWTSALGGDYATAQSIGHGKHRGRRSGGPPS